MAAMANHAAMVTPISISLLPVGSVVYVTVVERKEVCWIFLSIFSNFVLHSQHNTLKCSISKLLLCMFHPAITCEVPAPVRYSPYCITSWTHDRQAVTLRAVSVSRFAAVQPVFDRGDARCSVCPPWSTGHSGGMPRWVKALVFWRQTRCALIPGECLDWWVSIAAAGQSHRLLFGSQ